jgi:hypothetical protein
LIYSKPLWTALAKIRMPSLRICGIMSFFDVFMPHMLTNDGRRFVEIAEPYLRALPAPDSQT